MLLCAVDLIVQSNNSKIFQNEDLGLKIEQPKTGAFLDNNLWKIENEPDNEYSDPPLEYDWTVLNVIFLTTQSYLLKLLVS